MYIFQIKYEFVGENFMFVSTLLVLKDVECTCVN